MDDRKEKTRMSILDAAKKAFSSKGYHETSVSDIVSAVGVSQGSFYNYFSNKKEIFKTILEEYGDALCGVFASISMERIINRDSYTQAGEELAMALATLLISDPNLTRIFYWESPGIDPQFDEQIDRTYARLTDYSRQWVETGQRHGFVKKELDSVLVATAVVGMSSHILTRYLRGELQHLTPGLLVRELINLHLQGIFV